VKGVRNRTDKKPPSQYSRILTSVGRVGWSGVRSFSTKDGNYLIQLLLSFDQLIISLGCNFLQGKKKMAVGGPNYRNAHS
jgi:hypothetical protein